jgi:hypothetical protein
LEPTRESEWKKIKEKVKVGLPEAGDQIMYSTLLAEVEIVDDKELRRAD